MSIVLLLFCFQFIKEGIPFLNQEKSESLRKFLRANRHFMSTAEYLDPVSRFFHILLCCVLYFQLIDLSTGLLKF